LNGQSFLTRLTMKIKTNYSNPGLPLVTAPYLHSILEFITRHERGFASIQAGTFFWFNLLLNFQLKLLK